jgi:hypothetical protein
MESVLVMHMDELIAFMESSENDFIIHVQLEEEGKSDA